MKIYIRLLFMLLFVITLSACSNNEHEPATGELSEFTKINNDNELFSIKVKYKLPDNISLEHVSLTLIDEEGKIIDRGSPVDGEVYIFDVYDMDGDYYSLKSNEKYTVVLFTSYCKGNEEDECSVSNVVNNTESITLDVYEFTWIGEKPSASIDNVNINNSVLTFDYVYNNTNAVSEFYIGLFIDDMIIYRDEYVYNNGDKEYTNLLNDTEYKVKIIAKYNLGDGTGEQEEVIAEESITITNGYVKPTVNFNDVRFESDNIYLDFDISDVNEQLLGATLRILNSSQSIVYEGYYTKDRIQNDIQIGNNTLQLENALNNEIYTIEIEGYFEEYYYEIILATFTLNT